MTVSQLLSILFLMSGHLECTVCICCINATMKMLGHVFLVHKCEHFCLVDTVGIELLDHRVSCILGFSRYYQSSFPKLLYSLLPPAGQVLLPHILVNTWYCPCLLNFSPFYGYVMMPHQSCNLHSLDDLYD